MRDRRPPRLRKAVGLMWPPCGSSVAASTSYATSSARRRNVPGPSRSGGRGIRGKKCGQPLGREIMMSDDMDETLFEASVRVARARPQACPPPRTRRRSLSPDQTTCPPPRTRRRSLSPDQTRCPDLQSRLTTLRWLSEKVREAGLPLEYGPRANLGACAVSTFEIYWASSST